MMLALKVNRGHEPRNARNTALESGNIKETGSPPEHPGVWPCQHLDLDGEAQTSDFWNYKRVNVHCFKN